jgi:hypothetical protein
MPIHWASRGGTALPICHMAFFIEPSTMKVSGKGFSGGKAVSFFEVYMYNIDSEQFEWS